MSNNPEVPKSSAQDPAKDPKTSAAESQALKSGTGTKDIKTSAAESQALKSGTGTKDEAQKAENQKTLVLKSGIGAKDEAQKAESEKPQVLKSGTGAKDEAPKADGQKAENQKTQVLKSGTGEKDEGQKVESQKAEGQNAESQKVESQKTEDPTEAPTPPKDELAADTAKPAEDGKPTEGSTKEEAPKAGTDDTAAETSGRKSQTGSRKSRKSSKSNSKSKIRVGSKSGMDKVESNTGASSRKASSKRAKGEKATVETCRIGFIGAGKMAESIVRGLLDKGIDKSRIFVASKSGKTHEQFKQMGAVTTKRLYDIFAKYESDIIFMATHGLVIKECFKMGGTRPLALCVNFIPLRSQQYYVLSLVGGVSLVDIKKVLLNPEDTHKYKLEAHRIMLNASVSRGIGLGAIDAEIDSKKVAPLLRDVLVKIAKMDFYPESQMDILCCVGGNGLAFTYYFVAALADGGFKMGLPKKTAVTLATKTLHCTALCMLESGKHPSELRDQCASPSGPAIYGIANLERKDASSGISAAVEAAMKRVKELVDVQSY